MRQWILLAVLFMLAPLNAWALDCVSTGASTAWTTNGTWTSCGGGFPGINDTATIAAGHTVDINEEYLEAANLTIANTGVLQCAAGGTLTMFEWAEQSTDGGGNDWFVSQFDGDDGLTGTTEASPNQTWAGAITDFTGGAIDDELLFMKGGVYEVVGTSATFAEPGLYASYGKGSWDGVPTFAESGVTNPIQILPYGPRPLWHADSDTTFTNSSGGDVHLFHTEVSCGDSLTATFLTTRVSAPAPAAIQFMLDVNAFDLPSTEAKYSTRDVGTALRGGPDFIHPSVVWDFGDPAAGNWTRGAKATTSSPMSKNTEVGPLAVHVYETEGTYTATYTVNYGGQTVTGTATITITDPNTEWPTTDTYCFSTSGTFTDCPSGANEVITSSVQTALGASNCDIDDPTTSNRCLFRRGETFTSTSNNDITQTSGEWMIGAYGNPADPNPIIDSNGGNTFELQEDSHNGRIWDLDIDGGTATGDAITFTNLGADQAECSGPEFDNLLIGNVNIFNVGYGVNLRGSSDNDSTSPYRVTCNSDNVVVYNTTFREMLWNSPNGSEKDMFFNQPGLAVLGSDYGNRDVRSHPLRIKGAQFFIISHNDIGMVGQADEIPGVYGCAATRALSTIRADQAKTFWEAGERYDEHARNYTSHGMMQDNHLGVCNDGLDGFFFEGTSDGDFWEHHHSVVIQGNLFNAAAKTAGGNYKMMRVAGQDFLFANNAIWINDTTSSGDVSVLQITPAKMSGDRDYCPDSDPSCSVASPINIEHEPATTTQRIHVYNNSLFVGDNTNNLGVTFVSTANETENVFFSNNLILNQETTGVTVVSDGAGAVEYCNGDGASFGDCNDTRTSNTDFFSPSITGANPVDFDWFALEPGFSAGGVVPVVPVFNGAENDAYLDCRDGLVGLGGLDNVGADPCTSLLARPTWDNANSAIGMNLHWHRWDTTVAPFANIMKQAREWQASPSTCFSGASDFCTSYSGTCFNGDDPDGTVQCRDDDDCAGALGVCSLLNVCVGGASDGNDCADISDCTGSSTCSGRGKPDYSVCDSIQDSDGYPTSLDGNACVYTEWFDTALADGPYPTGVWSAYFDGGGTTPPAFDTGTAVQDGSVPTLSGNSFEFTVDSDGTSGESVQLAITDLGTPTISNMRVYPPGGFCVANADNTVRKHQFCSTADCPSGACPDAVACGSGDSCVSIDTVMEDPDLYGKVTFHPLWLSSLGQYRLLRFMNWNKTNASRVTEWSEHRPESFYTYDRTTHWPGEVPVETMVDLCNDANTDCHLNIPSLATDAHITEFVEYVAFNLNSNLKLYLEWSNEVWNPDFDQYRWAWQDALEAEEHLVFDGADCASSQADCQGDWYAKRTYEMCELAQAAMDSTTPARGDDLLCVFARRVSPSEAETADDLECERWEAAPNGDCYTGTELDVFAVNSYWGDASGAACNTTTANLCSEMASDISDHMISGTGGRVWEPADSFITKTGGGRVMVYEGGSNNWDSTGAACLALALETDTCLIDEYQDGLNGWRDLDDNVTVDTGTFVFFDQGGPFISGEGSVYHHRGSNEETWPKEAAILNWVNAAGNDCWWTDCTIGAATDPPGPPPVGTPYPSIQGGGAGAGGAISSREMEDWITWSLMMNQEEEEE